MLVNKNYIQDKKYHCAEFKNISNMKITNLKKKFEKENSIKIYDEKFDDEIIQNYFSNGEILFCDLITNEMWIKINFKLISYDFNKNIKIDFKFNNNLLFSKMKLILIKSGINLFLEQIKNNENFNKNVFYLKNYKFKLLINNKIVYDINLNNNEIIKNIFDINSEISVVLNFLNFEEIIFNELKNIKIKEIFTNKIKFNEFKELNFEDFMEGLVAINCNQIELTTKLASCLLQMFVKVALLASDIG